MTEAIRRMAFAQTGNRKTEGFSWACYCPVCCEIRKRYPRQ